MMPSNSKQPLPAVDEKTSPFDVRTQAAAQRGVFPPPDAGAAVGAGPDVPLAAMKDLLPELEQPDRTFVLGDYQLLRPVGRGGMGIVYEGCQLSLHKRVAVKVLPISSVLEERLLRRFQHEAWAAAQLDHPNIVPVYNVGYERGIHFYVMQFIDGCDLGRLIADLNARRAVFRSLKNAERQAPPGDSAGEIDLATRVEPGDADSAGTMLRDSDMAETVSHHPQDSPPARASVKGPPAAPPGLHDTDREPNTVVSRELSSVISKFGATSHPEYVKVFLRLAIQSADALNHAHQMGIVHRDIKPSNLMLDGKGKLWVTDFGLAQIQNSPSVTATGDIVGTLRYMSPEQALGKRVTVDHRTDIYSLGATLYELLTLEPAFSGQDREAVLRKIAFDEPTPPRKFDRRIPVELETIVLKSLSKNPDERYQTAGELSEDLQRFLNDEPITGRPPGVRQRAVRWAKRNRTAAIAAAGLGGIIFISSLIIAVMSSSFYAATAAMLKTEQEQSAQLAATLNKSEGLRLAANASLQATANPGRSLALALEASRRYPSSEANDAVLRALGELHELHTFTGHDGWVGSVDVSPNGHLAVSAGTESASGSGSPAARLWNLQSGESAGVLSDGEPITSAVFSPDGVRVLAGGGQAPAADDDAPRGGARVRVWDSVGLRKLVDFPDTFLLKADRRAFDPAGRRIVLPAYGYAAKIFDAIGGHELTVLRGHEKRVVFAGFDPSGERVVTVSDDNTVRLWNAADGSELLRLDFWRRQVTEGQSTAVYTLAFSPDGTRLATGGRLGLQLWDLETGAMVAGIPGTEHIRRFTSDGERFVTHVGTDRVRFHIRNAKSGAIIRSVSAPSGMVHSIVVRADSAALLAYDDSNLVVLDLTSGEVSELRGHESPVSAIAFVADKDEFVSGGWDRTVRHWHLRTDTQRAVIPSARAGEGVHAVSGDGDRVANRRPWRLSSFRYKLGVPESFSPIDAQVHGAAGLQSHFVAYRGEFVELRETATGNLVAEHRPDDYRVRNAFINRDGDRVAILNDRNQALLWFPQEDRVTLLEELEERFTEVAFGPENRLAVAEPSGKVTVWDTDTGARVTQLQHPSIISECLFSLQGGYLLTAAVDGRIVIWNTDSWTEALSLRVGREPTVAFSFDDRYVFTGQARNGTEVVCRNIESGERVSTLPLIAAATDLAAAPDRHAVAVAAAPGGTIYWQYEQDEHRVLSDAPALLAQFSPTGDSLVICTIKELLPRGQRRVFGVPGEQRVEFFRWTGVDLTAFERSSPDIASIHDFSIADDGWLIARHREHGINVRDLDSGDLLQTLHGHSAPISFVGFVPGSGDLVSASWDQTAVVWDAAAGRQKRVMRDHDGPIMAAAISKNGKRLITAAADGEAYLWSTETGRLLHRFRAIDSEPAVVSIDDTAELALVIGIDGQHTLYHLNEQQQIRPAGAPPAVRWAEWSADRSRILYVPREQETPPDAAAETVADEDGAEAAADSAELIISSLSPNAQPLVVPGAAAVTARFHPVDNTVLLLTDDETLRLIDSDTGETLKTLHEAAFQRIDRARTLAFSPGGELAAVGSRHYLRLWDLKTGVPRFTLDRLGPSLRVPETFQPFMPGERELLVPSSPGLVRIPLNPVDYARRIAPRELTANERRRYLLDEAEVAAGRPAVDSNQQAAH